MLIPYEKLQLESKIIADRHNLFFLYSVKLLRRNDFTYQSKIAVPITMRITLTHTLKSNNNVTKHNAGIFIQDEDAIDMQKILIPIA